MGKSIKLEQFNDMVTVTFDQENSIANVFDENMFAELNEHLYFLEDNSKTIKGVIFQSAKPSIFIAGADLKSFADDPTPERISYLVKLGQHTFDRIEDLSCVTVAAIHGACLGGGYELALACDHRVATLDSATKIGLPETMLGILPAWGGSTRLPRMIGIAGAMGIILAGKVVVPKLALKLGMIDRVVYKENLEASCKSNVTKWKKEIQKAFIKSFSVEVYRKKQSNQKCS